MAMQCSLGGPILVDCPIQVPILTSIDINMFVTQFQLSTGSSTKQAAVPLISAPTYVLTECLWPSSQWRNLSNYIKVFAPLAFYQ